MINEISLIPVEQLMHHPDNPRFDLGDLEELTASIRANGVLQNLTVVHAIRKMDETERARIEELYSQVQTEELRQRLETGEYEDPNMYWVVIGNRRFEAAQMAGLTELPCVIAEMNRHEQLATMLQENMQRSDLTVYEQAKGIQMMMDLGFNKDQISERTGFSKTTIDRRLAVATLPDKETQEAVECGWDLMDLVEISKIEDPEKQKKLLVDTPKGSLKQNIETAIRDQQRDKNKKRLLPEIEKFASEFKSVSDRYSSKYERVSSLTIDLENDSATVKVPDDAGKQKYYYCNSWGSIEFYKPVKKERHVKTEQEIAHEKRQHDAKELNDRMRERRTAFCATFTPTKKLESQLREKMFDWAFGWTSTYDNGGFAVSYHNWNSPLFRKLCGMPVEEGRDEKESILDEIKRRGIPMGRAVLAWILCGGIREDSRDGYCSQYDGRWKPDEDMDHVYQILEEVGYIMDEEELQWKTGTHEFYGDMGSEYWRRQYASSHPEESEDEEPEDEDYDGEEAGSDD